MISKSIIFLGGSGYICSSIRNNPLLNDFKIKFYSRRVSIGCIQYSDIAEIPTSDIILDFSQRADGSDLKNFGFNEMYLQMKKLSKLCNNYIFISSLNILLEQLLNYKQTLYTETKSRLEEKIYENKIKNSFIARIPSCFSYEPKENSLIKILMRRALGSNEAIKYPWNYTTGLFVDDLCDGINTIINQVDSINNNPYTIRRYTIADSNVYRISELDYFLREKRIEYLSKTSAKISINNSDNKYDKWIKPKLMFPARLSEVISNLNHNDLYNC
tara:strand:- start:3373 stop:4191 length:819 start_codon:yes stop_codon:yes gene_type:complete